MLACIFFVLAIIFVGNYCFVDKVTISVAEGMVYSIK